ncbi:MAG TPA: hypothetical protein VFU48_02555 [Nitrospira sp.]|nr:hypothetical protein [Nitrospira sp.]
MRKDWKFSSLIETKRQERLISVDSFLSIVDLIEHDMSVLCHHLQRCDDDSDYARPVFCVQVSEDLFDVFFNSPVGYRGSYFESPFYGLECNHHFIQKIIPHLSLWAEHNSPGYNGQFAHDALLAVSAKTWLAECAMHLCQMCIGEWSPPIDDEAEIINGRWDTSQQSNSKFGRKAPRHSKLRIFGAFLNAHRDEFIPSRKRHRGQEIHEQGCS